MVQMPNQKKSKLRSRDSIRDSKNFSMSPSTQCLTTTKNMAFRVTDVDYTRIEEAAIGAGDDANNWCVAKPLSAN